MKYRTSLLLIVLAACADPDRGPMSAPTTDASEPLLRGDLDGTWEHVGPVFQGPNGFYAYWSQPTDPVLGDGSPWVDTLYASADGATWNRVSIVSDGTKVGRHFGTAAYGGARFVVIGEDGGEPEILTSADGATWTATTQATPLTNLAYANGLFILGNTANEVQTSTDGSHWTKLAESLSFGNAAYGNGTYVVFGMCEVLLSTDGATWTTASYDANGTCISGHGFFADGTFYTDVQTSPDGKSWSTQTRRPSGSAGGFLFQVKVAVTEVKHFGLTAWDSGGQEFTVPAVESVPVSAFPSGRGIPATYTTAFPQPMTCHDHRCVVLAGDLYVID